MIRILGFILICLALAACGGDNTPATVQPSAVPPTDAPAGVELSQSYTSDGEMFPAGLTFQYPAGWVVTTPVNNIILIATSEAAASKTFSGSAFDAGEAVIQLALNTRTDENEDIAAHISGFAGGVGIPLGDASAVTLGGNPAARVDGSSDARHLMAVSVLFEDSVDAAAGSGDNYVEALAYTNPAEFAQMEATLLAIIESINYAAA